MAKPAPRARKKEKKNVAVGVAHSVLVRTSSDSSELIIEDPATLDEAFS